MTYKQLLNEYYEIAEELNKESSAIKELVLALCDLKPQDLYLSFNKEVPNLDFIKSKINEYLYDNKPIQYIIGYTYFYGLKFNVNQNVLIPRFDTEILVDEIIKRNKNKKNLKIIDLGTGSGCIAITLKKYLDDAKVYAIDISNEALEVAKGNAKENNVDINFSISDMLENVDERDFDIIVSNPPYITIGEDVASDVFKYEPHLALFSENDGMDHYERILMKARKYLNKDFLIAFEIAYNKKDKMKLLIEKYFPNAKIEVINDLSGRHRVMMIYER